MNYATKTRDIAALKKERAWIGRRANIRSDTDPLCSGLQVQGRLLQRLSGMHTKLILLAEDNPDDAFIFQMMIKRSGLPQTLHLVQDGQQAIDWLSGTGEYADRNKFPIPDLLFLDLKMPIKSGFDVLEWLREKKQFSGLPVMILSSSDDRTDVNRASQLGAKTYFVKSPQLKDVIQFLKRN